MRNAEHETNRSNVEYQQQIKVSSLQDNVDVESTNTCKYRASMMQRLSSVEITRLIKTKGKESNYHSKKCCRTSKNGKRRAFSL